MFKSIKDNFRKAEAAVIMENLLQEQVEIGVFNISLPPKELANLIIKEGWNVNPKLLGGRFGTRPHKLSIAAFCISAFILLSRNRKTKLSVDFINSSVLMFSKITNELDVNGRLYNLTETDNVVNELAVNGMLPIIEDLNSSSANGEFDAFNQTENELQYTWEEWYSIFVFNACSIEGNGLDIDENGACLIDFLENEPLKKAHADGICPIEHGVFFGNDFDMVNILRSNLRS